MDRREFLQYGMILAGSGVIAGCSDDTDFPNSGENNDRSGQDRPSGTKWYDYETKIGIMKGIKAEINSIGSMYIRGTAKNFSDTDYDYVQLSFSVYDDTDAKIADGMANTSGLSSGQRWRFEALALSAEGAASYVLEDTSVY